MAAVPPPPPPSETESDRDELLAALQRLETPELLALCERFGQVRERLATYLAVLRTRASPRDHLASVVVCFDLASLGDPQARREFLLLAPTLRSIASDETSVAKLLQTHPFLAAGWERMRLALADADPREASRSMETSEAPVAEIDLLSEEDFTTEEILDLEDIDIIEEDESSEERRLLAERQRAEFARRLLQHLGHQPERGLIRAGYGFALDSSRDLDRFEEFLQLCASSAAFVPAAAGLWFLGQLFLATHLRQRTLFGETNRRRREALHSGLLSLPADPEALAAAAAVFSGEGDRVVAGFQKVLELWFDYLRFCLATNVHPRLAASVDAYVAAGRVPEPLLAGAGVRRRR